VTRGDRLKPLVLVQLLDKLDMEQCMIFCRTNLDCDNLEQFLVSLDGGRRFAGKAEKVGESSSMMMTVVETAARVKSIIPLLTWCGIHIVSMIFCGVR
jgi:hypothetical protein